MILERRYLVVKLSRLTEQEYNALINHLETTGVSCLVDAVVIERPWPEYKPTVELLASRLFKDGAGLGGAVDDRADATAHLFIQRLGRLE